MNHCYILQAFIIDNHVIIKDCHYLLLLHKTLVKTKRDIIILTKQNDKDLWIKKKKHQKLHVLLLRWHDNINDFNPKT